MVLGPERLPVAIRTASHWIRLIRSTANSVKAELEQELKLQDLHNDLKKAERLQMNNLSPELQESIEQLKAAAQSVNRPYQGRTRSARLGSSPRLSQPPGGGLGARDPRGATGQQPARERACARQRVRSQRGGEAMSQAEQPLISHLVELRTRLLRAISAILLVFIALIYFSNNIYDFVAQPLLSQLPAGTSMIATDVATPFITPIKLTLVVSFFVAIPICSIRPGPSSPRSVPA